MYKKTWEKILAFILVHLCKGILVYYNPESSNANVRGNTIIRLYKWICIQMDTRMEGLLEKVHLTLVRHAMQLNLLYRLQGYNVEWRALMTAARQI
jgi:hypothetical protein